MLGRSGSIARPHAAAAGHCRPPYGAGVGRCRSMSRQQAAARAAKEGNLPIRGKNPSIRCGSRKTPALAERRMRAAVRRCRCRPAAAAEEQASAGAAKEGNLPIRGKNPSIRCGSRKRPSLAERRMRAAGTTAVSSHDDTTPHHATRHRTTPPSCRTPHRCRASHCAGAILHELSAGEGDTEFAVIPA